MLKFSKNQLISPPTKKKNTQNPHSNQSKNSNNYLFLFFFVSPLPFFRREFLVYSHNILNSLRSKEKNFLLVHFLSRVNNG